ncbi:hypothetical protein CGMCC3_g16781 [Colletotrichum fructicola]|nr:uncharacterized protein CGMCC3_g16781 [Colletotrichum fructicola]KAE9567067.1 hypothetical protein CGMCC3_g16781 [Colletotrichum fructicola]
MASLANTKMEPMSQPTPADVAPPANVAPPTDASPANAANWQPQGEAIELQSLAQPQTTPPDPQSPRPPTQTDAPVQHPPAPPIDERDILIPIPAPTTQGEAEAGVRRKLPKSGFPTAAELDESFAWFTKYLVSIIAVAGAQGTPALPAIILKASSRFYLS